MTIYFKDPMGAIRYINWNIGQSKTMAIHESLFIGAITASKQEADLIVKSFDKIPVVRTVSGNVTWTGDDARFIYLNL